MGKFGKLLNEGVKVGKDAVPPFYVALYDEEKSDEKPIAYLTTDNGKTGKLSKKMSDVYKFTDFKKAEKQISLLWKRYNDKNAEGYETTFNHYYCEVIDSKGKKVFG